MQNKLISFLLIALIMAVLGLYGLYFWKSSPAIAYVNTNKIILEYQGMKEAHTVLQGKIKGWQAHVDTLANELQTQVNAFEKMKASLSAKETTLNQELIRTKQQQLEQYRQAVQQKITEEDNKLREQVVSRIDAYLKAYGKKHSYAMILGATTMGNIVYAEPYTEVTEEVLKGLNEEYSKK